MKIEIEPTVREVRQIKHTIEFIDTVLELLNEKNHLINESTAQVMNPDDLVVTKRNLVNLYSQFTDIDENIERNYIQEI